ncbi:MAG: hypothetical protein KF757_06360 [Phycisphaeraceae bacterium]|nr:hypothetical protein [Phycisphaeraceae bacterium]MCW5763226.1 hypothetical protein [Phycisphaeraceae bacterium]
MVMISRPRLYNARMVGDALYVEAKTHACYGLIANTVANLCDNYPGLFFRELRGYAIHSLSNPEIGIDLVLFHPQPRTLMAIKQFIVNKDHNARLLFSTQNRERQKLLKLPLPKAVSQAWNVDLTLFTRDCSGIVLAVTQTIAKHYALFDSMTGWTEDLRRDLNMPEPWFTLRSTILCNSQQAADSLAHDLRALVTRKHYKYVRADVRPPLFDQLKGDR